MYVSDFELSVMLGTCQTHIKRRFSYIQSRTLNRIEIQNVALDLIKILNIITNSTKHPLNTKIFIFNIH